MPESTEITELRGARPAAKYAACREAGVFLSVQPVKLLACKAYARLQTQRDLR